MLWLLTVLVLLAHAMLLGGLSATLNLLSPGPANSEEPVALRFVTRTLATAPAPLQAPTPPATPNSPAPLAPVRARPALAPKPLPIAPVAPAETSTAPLPNAVATARVAEPPASAPNADPARGSDIAVVAAAAETPAEPVSAPPATISPTAPSTPKPAAIAQRANTLLPTPVRLLYDGRGEERGFIKYAASAELLWLPVGDAYSARMEISAWGLRVRTWTSKGTLGDSGLLPTRFGDKPRGPEQATHFQRDKGIISFSANNPDVPLLAGAQDKLSALLQLSAMVAGAPEQYWSGSAVSFQAADAHRAEQWVFKVGAMESLELPGGTLDGLKLSKDPTVEFDQRIEVWLAPRHQYLPVRLRITEPNGAFADLLWRNTQNPD